VNSCVLLQIDVTLTSFIR